MRPLHESYKAKILRYFAYMDVGKQFIAGANNARTQMVTYWVYAHIAYMDVGTLQ